MQRRFSLGVVVLVAVLALALGTLAGAVSGGITAYVVSDDDKDDTVAEATRTATVATSVSTQVVTPVVTPEPTLEQTPIPNQPVSASEQESIADIVERVSPAVVTVVNRQAIDGLFGSDGSEPAGTGTGFIINDQGHIVTNNHVVEGSEEIEVIFANGTEASATLLGTDRFADLAVIKIDAPVPAFVQFGDVDALRPGDRVIAIGSALGDFTNTVTQGIVSAKNRSLQTPEGFNMEDMIQHDAPINPGNSGGPLLNLGGEVVGVNTAVVRQAGFGVSAEGLGFAIPSNTVEAIIGQIIEDGRVVRPYIGVTYETLTPRSATASDLPIENGVVIREVVPGSPAEQAGIQIDDVITKINGTPIDDENPLVNQLFHYDVGESVEMEIYRASTDETFTVTVTLAERPENT